MLFRSAAGELPVERLRHDTLAVDPHHFADLGLAGRERVLVVEEQLPLARHPALGVLHQRVRGVRGLRGERELLGGVTGKHVGVPRDDPGGDGRQPQDDREHQVERAPGARIDIRQRNRQQCQDQGAERKPEPPFQLPPWALSNASVPSLLTPI